MASCIATPAGGFAPYFLDKNTCCFIISFQVDADTERRFFRGDWWKIQIRYLQFTPFHWYRLSIRHISFTESFPNISKMSHLETGETGQRCKKHFLTWFDSKPISWKGKVSESPKHYWMRWYLTARNKTKLCWCFVWRHSVKALVRWSLLFFRSARNVRHCNIPKRAVTIIATKQQPCSLPLLSKPFV